MVTEAPGQNPLALAARWGTPGPQGHGGHEGRWPAVPSAKPPGLSPRTRDFLAGAVGTPAEPSPPVPPQDWRLGPCRLTAEQWEALAGAVGESAVSTERDVRLAHTGGASYVDYLRHRSGDFADAPDAVVTPPDHDSVVRLLQACSREGIAVIPVGGGTSVVGGTSSTAPHIAISMERLGGLLDVDEVSCLATVGPGITGPRLEPLLAARGFTLGHLPQSWQRATIGGYVATRSAGQASSGYGRSDDMVESLRVATPRGTLELGRGPSSAAGPDLRGLLVGSEGIFGVITRVTLRIRRLPDTRIYEGVMLPSFAAGREAFRAMAQDRASADVMRLSDGRETTATMLMSGPTGKTAVAMERYLGMRGIVLKSEEPALAILGWEGAGKDHVRDRRQASWRHLKRHGAVSLGRRTGESWRAARFGGPFLRDVLMDEGYLVETVETAATWSALPGLHAAIEQSLRESLDRAWVMTHISHVYETGASLYTTVVAVADRNDPVAQWRRAKRAVSDAICAHDGTITHHHAVGRDHVPWLAQEVGELGIDTLAAVKAALDPAGVMNPGAVLGAREP